MENILFICIRIRTKGVMEKEIELIRMSSIEIMEKVAAYKDEEIIRMNQTSEQNGNKSTSMIRAGFF